MKLLSFSYPFEFEASRETSKQNGARISELLFRTHTNFSLFIPSAKALFC